MPKIDLRYFLERQKKKKKKRAGSVNTQQKEMQQNLLSILFYKIQWQVLRPAKTARSKKQKTAPGLKYSISVLCPKYMLLSELSTFARQ